jgi:periplasmic divalent cation tolerance protein
MIVVYVTYPNLKTAKRIVNVLLEKRLIACANLFPIESIYRWNDRVENSKEIVSVLKTDEKNWSKLQKTICELHPFDVPCIIKIKVEVNKEYSDWLMSCL